MRLRRYVLLELLLVTSVVLGMGTAVGWGSSLVLRRLEARGRSDPSALYPLRTAVAEPPEPAVVSDIAGTFLGMSDDLLLERVRTQPIARVKLNHGGSSLSFRVDFADGSRAAFKPAQTNLQTIPRKEVAAYRINRMLGLNAVPPAAPRSVSREDIFDKLHPDSLPALPRIRAETIFNPLGKTPGVFSYWIPEIKESGLDTPEGIKESTQWLSQGNPIPPEKRAMAAQVSDLIVFDFVTENPDRYSGGNMKMSPDGSSLYFMDNTMAFFLDPQGHEKNRAALQRTQRFSKHLYQALDRITVSALEELLSEDVDANQAILTPSEIRAVVARREVAQRYIDTLASAYGPRNVLVFP
jgi:hypothetical protein